jgi:two-component system, OmpR family, sensor kinase
MMARGPHRGTLRTKVVAGVLAIVIAALAVFDFTAVSVLRRYLIAQTDANLSSALRQTQPKLTKLLPQYRKPGVTVDTPVFSQYAIEFVPVTGTVVTLQGGAGSAPLPGQSVSKVAEAKAKTVISSGGQARIRVSSVSVPGLSGTLVAGINLSDVDATIGQLRLIVIIGSGTAAALIFVGVSLVMRRGLRPIEMMAAWADRITAGDLTDRVGPADAGSEVGRLGAALNGMLGRIAASVTEREAGQELMRRFFAEASHELRTPLASLRANAELYAQGALTKRSQVDEAMRRIMLEAERMSRLVDDMLRLARLDQHPERQRDPVDLTVLVHDCVERAEIADPARTWRAYVAAGLVTVGDREMLSRAVDNLLANVRAHTPEGTVATVTASQDGAGRVVVEVSDNGPGVPADRLCRIFDRFYRAGSPRYGSGLGLAIVAEVAAAHEGTAHATLRHPHGLSITLTLPGRNPALAGAARGGLDRAHPVVARVVRELGEAERLQQRGHVHAEPAAIALAQPVPAADRVADGPAPCLDRALGGVLALVGRAERDPAGLLGQPFVQVVDGPELVLQGGGADLADQRRRVGLLVPVHGVAGGARRGLEHPRVFLGASGHVFSPLDGYLVVRQQRLPADMSAVAPRLAVGAQALPAAVGDVDPGLRGALRAEADLHLGGVSAVPAQVPQVDQPGGGLPDRDLAPLVLGAVGGALVDPAADAAGQDDALGAAGNRVVGGPPGADAGGPDPERVLGRAGHLERDPQRGGHDGSVFSAISRKRRAASPQTCSR